MKLRRNVLHESNINCLGRVWLRFGNTWNLVVHNFTKLCPVVVTENSKIFSPLTTPCNMPKCLNIVEYTGKSEILTQWIYFNQTGMYQICLVFRL